MKTQEELITDHLLSGKTLTPLEALEKFGCFRLAARIHEIRRAINVRVDRLSLPNGKSVACYRIEA